jgi:site-specific recombinase XerD
MHHTALTALNAILIHIEAAYAPNTIRAYRVDMQEFIRYCEAHGLTALPADPATVAQFLMTMSCRGIKTSTIRRKKTSIGAVHRYANLADPTQHPEVKLALRKLHRQLGRRFDQAYAVTLPILHQLLAATGDDLRGLRDRALLLLAYDSMRRRSELVSLRLDDMEWHSPNEASVLLRRSKTDQLSAGHWLHLSSYTTLAVKAWTSAAKIDSGFIIRGIKNNTEVTVGLGDGQVGRIYKSLARRAKLSPQVVEDISGHSMRVGGAQDLLTQGASLPQIMVKGGWLNPDTVMRYVERVRAHVHVNFVTKSPVE